MSLRLILIRHAKSSWGDPDRPDHARVLNSRGRAAATAIGNWLADQGHQPDLILCSDAARTAETAARISAELPKPPELALCRALYLAPAHEMQAILAQQKARCLALIGHNPGIGALAHALVKTPPQHPRFADYPTCATTIIDFSAIRWSALNPGICKDFLTPHDLPGRPD